MLATAEILKNKILEFSNGDDPEFDNWPANIQESAECWADVLDLCTQNIVPPSTTQPQARTQFINIFLNMSINSQNGYTVFANAMFAYASQLANGMVSAGFTGVPPPTPFIFNMGGMVSSSSSQEALKLAIDIVTWFKTGTAININTGAIINWS